MFGSVDYMPRLMKIVRLFPILVNTEHVDEYEAKSESFQYSVYLSLFDEKSLI